MTEAVHHQLVTPPREQVRSGQRAWNPSPVRHLVAEDIDGLISTLRLMHAENGMFALCEDKVRTLIEGAIASQPSMIIGVIGVPDNIEASIGLGLSQVYYSNDWHIGDFWNYVREDCRKTDHSRKLVEFAKSASERTRLKLVTGVVAGHRTDAKIELYRRMMGPLIGALFLYDPKGQS